jgi:hypothetical protein
MWAARAWQRGWGRAAAIRTGATSRRVQLPNPGGVPALPMSGGVGAQYTPTAGWAQAIRYGREVLATAAYDAQSRWCWAATRRWRPTVSGRR